MMKRMVHCIRNKYKKLAHKEQKVIFGRRLGEYKYYDMDDVVESALKVVSCEKE